MATYRLFSSVEGPPSPVSYSGPFLAGVLFQVTSGGIWFDGYWWWVCDTGQSGAAQAFALWAIYANGTGHAYPGRHGQVRSADRGAVELRTAA